MRSIKLAPATLDTDETEIFYELLTAIPEKLESNGVKEDRESERARRDLVEQKDEELSEIENIDDSERDNKILNDIYHCNKNIEVLSQVLRNNVGNLGRL